MTTMSKEVLVVISMHLLYQVCLKLRQKLRMKTTEYGQKNHVRRKLQYLQKASAQLSLMRGKNRFFLYFFPLALIESIVNQTNGYAARCIQEKADSLWHPTTLDEMMAFLKIH